MKVQRNEDGTFTLEGLTSPMTPGSAPVRVP